MSRAFTKERDDMPEPEVVLPRATEKHAITAAGLASLVARRDAATDVREREALERRIESAYVVEPPEQRDVVAFGATVVVSGEESSGRHFTIVGEDEADVRAGRVSVTSPLAAALLGAHAHDTVVWHRPAGDRALTVESIRYER